MTPLHSLLDTVALTSDLPAAGLRKGDIGVVVEILGPDGFEVEFVSASGRTQALVTVTGGQLRGLGDNDLLTVRSLADAAA